MKIADAFLKLFLDDTGLGADAVRIGDKAGKTTGEHISKGMSTALSVGLKTGLGVLAGGAAIALKGLTELDSITSKFAADTGATTAEVKEAGKAINRLAGDNLQSLGEVGDAYTAVRVQMGLTGKEQERITDLALKYATATHQDVVPAIKAMDDIQDAWNLTSADTQAIMDDLIASHQKYGGEIADNQAALAKMAPQLLALNADWRDGIGLLNLFAASGLDSEKALTALNTAVKKLKPGQNLDDLVREVSSIEDPTKRAQKAIELFGAKGGVALANALKPGVTSLKDFEINANDAAGATEQAAGRIEGSFTNRIRLAIKAVGAQIIGLGQDWGPFFTGAAGAVALLGSLGLDKPIAHALEKAGASATVRGAAASAGAAIGGVMSAAFEIGEKLVEAALEGLNAIAERAGIKVIAAKAGSIIGGIFAAAMSLAEKIGETAVDAFVKLPGIPKLRNAVLAGAIEIGTLQGTAIGAAASAALAGVVLTVPLLIIPQIPDIQKWLNEHNPFSDQAGKDVVTAFTKHMNDAANDAGQAAGQALTAGFVAGAEDTAQDAGIGVAGSYGDAMVAAWKDRQVKVSKVISSSIGNMRADWIKVARENGRRAAGAVAQGIVAAQGVVDQAWQDLGDLIKNQQKPWAREATLLGRLGAISLARALSDSRPAVRQQAEFTLQATLDELRPLVAKGYKIGKDGMEALRRAMHSKNPEIRAAGIEIYNAATAKPKQLPKQGYGYGQRFATGIAHGMTSPAAMRAIENAGRTITRRINAFTKISSPAEEGPWSEDGGPEGSGLRFAESLAKGIRRGIPQAASAAAALSSAVAPSLAGALTVPSAGGLAVPGAALTSSVSSSHFSIGEIHLHGVGSDVSPARAKRFGQAVADESALALRQQGARLGIHPSRF